VRDSGAVEKLFHQPGLSDSPAAPDEDGAPPPRPAGAGADGSEQVVEKTELSMPSDESVHCENLRAIRLACIIVSSMKVSQVKVMRAKGMRSRPANQRPESLLCSDLAATRAVDERSLA
jgi:hypothetical protein